MPGGSGGGRHRRGRIVLGPGLGARRLLSRRLPLWELQTGGAWLDLRGYLLRTGPDRRRERAAASGSRQAAGPRPSQDSPDPWRAPCLPCGRAGETEARRAPPASRTGLRTVPVHTRTRTPASVGGVGQEKGLEAGSPGGTESKHTRRAVPPGEEENEWIFKIKGLLALVISQFLIFNFKCGRCSWIRCSLLGHQVF